MEWAIRRFDTTRLLLIFHGEEHEAFSFCRQLYYDMGKTVSYFYEEVV